MFYLFMYVYMYFKDRMVINKSYLNQNVRVKIGKEIREEIGFRSGV